MILLKVVLLSCTYWIKSKPTDLREICVHHKSKIRVNYENYKQMSLKWQSGTENIKNIRQNIKRKEDERKLFLCILHEAVRRGSSTMAYNSSSENRRRRQSTFSALFGEYNFVSNAAETTNTLVTTNDVYKHAALIFTGE